MPRHNPEQRPHSRHRFRNGGALIEAALVLPIVVGLTFGMVEAGYFFFVKHTLQAAARDGARAGIVPSGTNTTVTASVATSMQAAGLNDIGYQVAVQHGTTNASLNVSTAPAQTPVKVVVSCTWSGISAGLRPMGVIAASKQVTGAAVMLKE